MDHARWLELRAAFEAAVEVPVHRRAAYAASLELAPDVREELIGMLEADARNQDGRRGADAGSRLHRLLRAIAEATGPALASD
ncbi:hypothetical protein [Chiayiivirga flava]|uniref:Uncharacterized protein n=1 Tax=Chiayiivirga flava TaxID=659595 RepID=A0A7W8D9T5_9GAMM|nr:hypothetical protein [Chiayiivirga flava]MBB5208773.1 hypothetical protein [Chiayiivirga flava]